MIYDILNKPDMEYAEKQLHKVPEAPSIIRESFLLKEAKGRVVLDIGASGRMHDAIVKIARKCYGIDRPLSRTEFQTMDVGTSTILAPGQPGSLEIREQMFYIDLDYYHAKLPVCRDVTRVICGEVLEHLSNPGWFLERLKRTYGGVRTIFTVPNAFCSSGRKQLETGIENVNSDHVAYYSWKTMSVLLGRFGYEVKEFYWYKGRPKFSEGLIIVTE